MIFLSAVSLPHPATPRPRRTMEKDITTPHLSYLGEIVSVAVAVCLPILAAAVCRFLEVEMGGEPSHFLFLCLVGLQLAIYRSLPHPRRDSTVFLATLALIFIYVGALAVALTVGLSPLWALVIPLITPVSYAVGFLVVKVRRARRAKV